MPKGIFFLPALIPSIASATDLLHFNSALAAHKTCVLHVLFWCRFFVHLLRFGCGVIATERRRCHSILFPSTFALFNRFIFRLFSRRIEEHRNAFVSRCVHTFLFTFFDAAFAFCRRSFCMAH